MYSLDDEDDRFPLRHAGRRIKKLPQRLCSRCSKRPPQFRVQGGKVQADKHHNMCMQCTRELKSSLRAKQATTDGSVPSF